MQVLNCYWLNASSTEYQSAEAMVLTTEYAFLREQWHDKECGAQILNKQMNLKLFVRSSCKSTTSSLKFFNFKLVISTSSLRSIEIICLTSESVCSSAGTKNPTKNWKSIVYYRVLSLCKYYACHFISVNAHWKENKLPNTDEIGWRRQLQQQRDWGEYWFAQCA